MFVDEYKEDGLKFTINEHILDEEKDIDYDPHEDYVGNDEDYIEEDREIEDNNDNDWSVSVYKAEQKHPKRKVKLKN
jgi:hypothetical protein